MSKAKLLSAIFLSAGVGVSAARATTTAAFVPVPISASALADDPNLANYQSWDLQVGLPAGDKWASTEMRASLSSGKFYIPPTNDSNVIQPSLMNSPVTRYLKFDTMVMRPVFDPGTVILGGSDISPTPGSAEFPSNGHNLKDPNDPTGTTFLPANDEMITDAWWNDPQAFFATYSTPANYTIARLTFLTGSTGLVYARMHDVNSPGAPERFTFIIPEPSATTLAALFGVYTVGRRRNRSFPPKLYP